MYFMYECYESIRVCYLRMYAMMRYVLCLYCIYSCMLCVYVRMLCTRVFMKVMYVVLCMYIRFVHRSV